MLTHDDGMELVEKFRARVPFLNFSAVRSICVRLKDPKVRAEYDMEDDGYVFLRPGMTEQDIPDYLEQFDIDSKELYEVFPSYVLKFVYRTADDPAGAEAQLDCTFESEEHAWMTIRSALLSFLDLLLPTLLGLDERTWSEWVYSVTEAERLRACETCDLGGAEYDDE